MSDRKDQQPIEKTFKEMKGRPQRDFDKAAETTERRREQSIKDRFAKEEHRAMARDTYAVYDVEREDAQKKHAQKAVDFDSEINWGMPWSPEFAEYYREQRKKMHAEQRQEIEHWNQREATTLQQIEDSQHLAKGIGPIGEDHQITHQPPAQITQQPSAERAAFNDAARGGIDL